MTGRPRIDRLYRFLSRRSAFDEAAFFARDREVEWNRARGDDGLGGDRLRSRVLQVPPPMTMNHAWRHRSRCEARRRPAHLEVVKKKAGHLCVLSMHGRRPSPADRRGLHPQ